MNTMKWLIKRELWEHKGGFLWVPVAVGAVVVFLVALVLVSIETNGHVNVSYSASVWSYRSETPSTAASAGAAQASAKSTVSSPAERREARMEAIQGVAKEAVALSALPILLASYFVSLFYLAGTMYEERKNRSILFWKSLPVTDASTVTSKVLTALVVAPALAYVIAIVVGILVFILCATAQLFEGSLNINWLLDSTDVLQTPLFLLGSIPVYALWALPTAGVLLTVGAWARSNPLLWVVTVPLVVGAGLTWVNDAFGVSANMDWYWRDIVGRGLLSNAPFSWVGLYLPSHPSIANVAQPASPTSLLWITWRLVATANLWLGVAAGCLMIVAATRLRRWRDEG